MMCTLGRRRPSTHGNKVRDVHEGGLPEQEAIRARAYQEFSPPRDCQKPFHLVRRKGNQEGPVPLSCGPPGAAAAHRSTPSDSQSASWRGIPSVTDSSTERYGPEAASPSVTTRGRFQQPLAGEDKTAVPVRLPTRSGRISWRHPKPVSFDISPV